MSAGLGIALALLIIVCLGGGKRLLQIFTFIMGTAALFALVTAIASRL